MQDQDRGVWPPPPDCEPFGSRGHVSHPHNPFRGVPGLGLAMRMCRYVGADGAVVGLAHYVKRVPADYLAVACTIGKGPEVHVVSCPCGVKEFVAAELVECRGECGRWYFGDASGVFAIKLPES